MTWSVRLNFLSPTTDSGISTSLSSQLQEAIKRNDPTSLAIYDHNPELINSSLPNGELPLHFAIRQKADKVVEWLFKHPSIDTSKKDDQGLTPLDHLYLLEDQPFQSLVLSQFLHQKTESVKAASNSISAEQVLTIKGQIELKTLDFIGMKDLCAGTTDEDVKQHVRQDTRRINQQTLLGKTLLHYAAEAGKDDLVRWLLDNGAQADLVTVNGVSALHLAAKNNRSSTVKLLIERGFDAHAVDDGGFTPLHYATLCDDFSTARTLVETGVNPLAEGPYGISPLALMTSIAQQRSSERDPLRIGVLQTLLCACYVATWINSVFGDSSGLLDSVLQSASSSLLLCTTAGYLFGAYRSAKDITAFARACFIAGLSFGVASLSSLPFFGELGLALRTIAVTQCTWDGLKTSWRNLHLDPIRATKKALVQSTNAALSVWSIYQRVQKIFNDANLNADVNAQLADGQCSMALKTASRMYWHGNQDTALANIAQNPICIAEQPDIAKAAIHQMNYAVTRNDAIATMANHHLTNGQCANALSDASEITYSDSRNKLLASIANHPMCLQEHPEITRSAAKRISYSDSKNAVLTTMTNYHLTNGQCANSLSDASEITYSDSRNKLLASIATDSTCLQEHPEITRGAAKQISYSDSKNAVLTTMANHHLTNGQCANSLSDASEITYSDSRNKLLASIATDSTCLKEHPETTRAAAQQISYSDRKNAVLMTIAYQHLLDGQCAEALSDSSEITYRDSRNEVLASIATDSTCLQEHPEITRAAAQQISYSDSKNIVLTMLAYHHLKNEQCADALSDSSEITYRDDRNKLLATIANHPACLDEQPDTARNAAVKISGWMTRDAILNNMTAYHLENGNCDQALKAASELESGTNYELGLQKVATDLTCLEKSKDTVDEAKRQLQSFAWWNPIRQTLSVAAIPSLLYIQWKMFSSLARDIHDPLWKSCKATVMDLTAKGKKLFQ